MQNGSLKTTNKSLWLSLVLPLVGLFCWLGFFYQKAAGNLWFLWQTDEYSHAPLLVLIAVLWGIRLLQSDTKWKAVPSRMGLVLLLAGFVFGIISKVASNSWIEQLSLVISIAGVAGLFLGRSALKKLLPPLGLLLLAIPLPKTIVPLFTAKMQLLSSDLGVAGLQMLGFAVFQEGNVIDIGAHKLYVAEACSGLRYVFPLISIGYLVAFHAFDSTAKRFLLILSTLPIALLSNGLRIAITGIVADQFGIEYVEGTLHEFEGFAVFFFCLLCLAGVYALMNLLSPKGRKEVTQLLPQWKPIPLAKAPKLPPSFIAILCLIISLSALGLFGFRADRNAASLQRESFFSFPLRIKDWKGSIERLSNEELKSLQLDDYLLANFVSEKSTNPINLYVAYYASQEQGRSIHSPEICLPGAGWEIASRTVHVIVLPEQRDQPLNVTREIIRKENHRQIVYYWFNESGINTPSNWKARLLLLQNAFSKGRTDGSLLRVTLPIGSEQNPEEGDRILEEFIAEVLPLMPRFLPKN